MDKVNKVAKRKTANADEHNPKTLSFLGVEDAYYMVSVSREKFDLERFVAAAGGEERYREGGGLAFAPQDPNSGEYHVRFSWYVTDAEVRLRVEYVMGARQHADDEHPPYAEDFMVWLGSFFKYESAQTHTHAHLRFPLKSRRSLFPLPLRTAMVGDPEIEGISLKIPAKPEGISSVRISMGSKAWHLEVIADKRITFRTFNIQEDVGSYTATLDTLMEKVS